MDTELCRYKNASGIRVEEISLTRQGRKEPNSSTFAVQSGKYLCLSCPFSLFTLRLCHHYLSSGGLFTYPVVRHSRFLWNAVTYLPGATVSHPSRQLTLQSLLRECQISKNRPTVKWLGSKLSCGREMCRISAGLLGILTGTCSGFFFLLSRGYWRCNALAIMSGKKKRNPSYHPSTIQQAVHFSVKQWTCHIPTNIFPTDNATAKWWYGISLTILQTSPSLKLHSPGLLHSE